MVGLLRRDDWCVCGQREVDTWVRYQVGLELCQIDIQGTIESQGGCDGAHDLADQPIKKEIKEWVKTAAQTEVEYASKITQPPTITSLLPKIMTRKKI